MNDRLPVSTPASAPEEAPEACAEGNDLLQQYAELHTQTVGGLVDLMARMRSGSECFKAVEIQQDATYLAQIRREVAKYTESSDPIRAHLRRLSPDDFMQHRCSLRTYRSMLEDAVGAEDAATLLAIVISHEVGLASEEKVASLESKLQSAGARIMHGMPLMTERGVVWWPFHLVYVPGETDIRLWIHEQMKEAAREIKSGVLQVSPEAESVRNALAGRISGM